MTPADLSSAVDAAVASAVRNGQLTVGVPAQAVIERPRSRALGEYATAVALRLAKSAGRPAPAVAAAIAAPLRATSGVADVRIAANGFLSITVDRAALGELPGRLLTDPDAGVTDADDAAAIAATAVERVRRASTDPAIGPAYAALVAAAGDDLARYRVLRVPSRAPADLDPAAGARRADDNPAYAVRHAHARTTDLARQAATLGIERGTSYDAADLSAPGDLALLTTLGEYPDVVAAAARRAEPERVARYLEALAGELVTLLESDPVLPRGDEPTTPRIVARLWLIAAVRVVLAAGLGLLGVATQERM